MNSFENFGIQTEADLLFDLALEGPVVTGTRRQSADRWPVLHR
jgi:hypothetical protein